MNPSERTNFLSRSPLTTFVGSQQNQTANEAVCRGTHIDLRGHRKTCGNVHDSIYVLKERFTRYSQHAYQSFSRGWDERRMSPSMRAEKMVYGISQSLAFLAV